MGGKEYAIQYLLNSYGQSWDSVACIGDDYNDINMLSKAKYTYTHSGAISEVKNLVKSKNGYVSPYHGHNGTVDLLKKLLDELN
ncbi:MAG: HAD hydrolase family protein [Nanoarchaeota archaeon]|nr:HAD hydrolase family protein [Nanoarchaeota archaeon]MBU1270311.1 HAD hydrolase family protein [Nanoarchaeota archaeon]MBU1604521.1 HAD hydrolase family protein [Nanoarchaeota archaeon]MBU2442856.1 HAD hydrolase family protein [Nanoarchaeota archaeon]